VERFEGQQQWVKNLIGKKVEIRRGTSTKLLKGFREIKKRGEKNLISTEGRQLKKLRPSEGGERA